MKARLIHRWKDVTADGDIIEMVIWQLPDPLPPTRHGFKYRLVYIVDGKRVIGFDNERGKGDHRHIGDQELPYRFESIERLIEDFIEAVAAWRRRP